MRTGWWATAIGIVTWSMSLQGQPAPVEHQVKAAFVLNFIDYTEWPAGAAARPSGSPFVLCAMSGAGPSTEALRVAAAGIQIQGRPVEVAELSPDDDATRCQVVLVAAGQHQRWTGSSLATGAAPQLTIGEEPTFLETGGVIRFVREGTRVRFEINRSEAERRGLKLSAKVLRLARRVVTSTR